MNILKSSVPFFFPDDFYLFLLPLLNVSFFLCAYYIRPITVFLDFFYGTPFLLFCDPPSFLQFFGRLSFFFCLIRHSVNFFSLDVLTPHLSPPGSGFLPSLFGPPLRLLTLLHISVFPADVFLLGRRGFFFPGRAESLRMWYTITRQVFPNFPNQFSPLFVVLTLFL